MIKPETKRFSVSASLFLTMGLVAFVATTMLASGCSIAKPAPTAVYKKPYPVRYPPPFLPIPPARASIVPTSQFMKVAVFNAIDQTGKSGRLVEALADMFSTELHATQRFEIYDRGQLRHYDYAQATDQCKKGLKNCGCIKGDKSCLARNKYLIKDFERILGSADAVLFTAITSNAGGVAEVDYRLVNARSYTVMVAGTASIGFAAGGGQLRVERKGVTATATKIKSQLPKPEIGRFGKVLVQDGPVLTISIGRNEGIIPGMNIFVIEPSRGAGGARTVVDEVYLAQAYVVSVYKNSSQVVVFRGTDYRVGDNVRFK